MQTLLERVALDHFANYIIRKKSLAAEIEFGWWHSSPRKSQRILFRC